MVGDHVFRVPPIELPGTPANLIGQSCRGFEPDGGLTGRIVTESCWRGPSAAGTSPTESTLLVGAKRAGSCEKIGGCHNRPSLSSLESARAELRLTVPSIFSQLPASNFSAAPDVRGCRGIGRCRQPPQSDPGLSVSPLRWDRCRDAERTPSDNRSDPRKALGLLRDPRGGLRG